MSQSPYCVDILTIFPEFFESPLGVGVIAKALDRGLATVQCTHLRDFTTDKHRTTDDVPYGGGAGMVMKPEPIVAAIESITPHRPPHTPRIYLTPQGEPLTQRLVQELSMGPGMIVLCGRYEGVDARVRQGWIDREISLGDFVLTGGEPGALVLLDAVVRLLPGVLGNPDSIVQESFSAHDDSQTLRLDYPHYTRPQVFRGMPVPQVLLSGHHGKIAQWRLAQALAMTAQRRPDLLLAGAVQSEE